MIVVPCGSVSESIHAPLAASAIAVAPEKSLEITLDASAVPLKVTPVVVKTDGPAPLAGAEPFMSARVGASGAVVSVVAREVVCRTMVSTASKIEAVRGGGAGADVAGAGVGTVGAGVGAGGVGVAGETTGFGSSFFTSGTITGGGGVTIDSSFFKGGAGGGGFSPPLPACQSAGRLSKEGLGVVVCCLFLVCVCSVLASF